MLLWGSQGQINTKFTKNNPFSEINTRYYIDGVVLIAEIVNSFSKNYCKCNNQVRQFFIFDAHTVKPKSPGS